MANVAFIGLGKMGFPMALRLLQAGHRVYAFNRSRGPVDALAKQGAEPAGSAADAAVSGGPAGAQAGTLTVMVGGEPAAFEAAVTVFQAFGKNIRLCGGIGAG